MTPIVLPTPAPVLSRTGWAVWLAALALLCGLVPVLNLLVPEDSVFHLSDFAVGLVAKIAVLLFIIIFIQKRPQGIFAMKGRSAEA